MTQQFKDHLELHFLVILWGFTAILGLLIDLPPAEVVFFRTLISFLLLAIIVKLLGEQFRVDSKDLLRMIIIGALFAAHWITFFLSARLSNASICLVGMATTPLWTSFIEPIINKKRVSKLEAGLSMVTIVGIAIVFQAEFQMAWGLFWAIVSALLSAVFTISNKRIAVRFNPFKIMFYEMLSACFFTVAFLLVWSGITSTEIIWKPSSTDLFYLLILAGLCTVYAYSMSVKLLKRLTAFVINFTINLEPVYGIILAVLFFGESEIMGLGFYLGGLVIFLSVVSYPFLKKHSVTSNY
ncbi:MAG: DMT family transporter [Cyclobacteriaceae bacterium]